MKNADKNVVEDFGDEWNIYDHNSHDEKLEESFKQYFSLMPKKYLNSASIGFDAGCGSGRWARYIAPMVKHLNCFDASYKALKVAKRNLNNFENCSFKCESIDDCSLDSGSMDFGYCLGLLHHLPDTLSALAHCVSKLKKDSPMLIYMYYRFDNKPNWFKLFGKYLKFLED